MKTITFRVPHGVRLSIGILSASIGERMSDYVRRLLDVYADEINGEKREYSQTIKPPSSAWEWVSLAMKEEGPDATMCIRVSKRVLAVLDEVTIYSRAAVIRSIILSHIIRNSKQHPFDKVSKMSENLLDITRKCRVESTKLLQKAGEIPKNENSPEN